MAWVNVTNVSVKCSNPAPLNTNIALEVSFQCLQDLTLPIAWRLIYVGCAGDKSKDQELESVDLGPIKKGLLKFTFESDPPDFTKIDPEDIWGTTVILLEGSYRNQDFIRIGWYVHNVYLDPEIQDDPPDIPIMSQLVRYIAADEPRVTRFSINWSGEVVHLPSLPNHHAIVEQMPEETRQALLTGAGAGVLLNESERREEAASVVESALLSDPSTVSSADPFGITQQPCVVTDFSSLQEVAPFISQCCTEKSTVPQIGSVPHVFDSSVDVEMC